jgi:hypothetical protein
MHEMNPVDQLAAAGKFSEAIQALQQSPTYDATYFFNLGILYGRSNQPGLAYAHFEKANRLNPHDPEVIRNLKLAKQQFEQKLSQSEGLASVDTVSNSFEQFADRIQADEILGVMGLVLVVVSLLWIRAYLKTRHLTKTFLKPSGWFGVLALIIVSALYGVHKAGSLNPPAMVMIRLPLRSGPGLNYPELNALQPGIKVRLVGSAVTVNENELWQKVRYKADLTAWLPLSALLPL